MHHGGRCGNGYLASSLLLGVRCSTSNQLHVRSQEVTGMEHNEKRTLGTLPSTSIETQNWLHKDDGALDRGRLRYQFPGAAITIC